MINFNIPVLDTTNFQKGMEDQEVENRSTRLKNREALMKLSDQAAQNGQSLTYEDLARMSQEHLGNASFLSVTSPSASMFESLQAAQNKQAERVVEVRRREAFKNTEEEGQSVEKYLSGLYAQGVPDIEALQKSQEKYGADVVDRVKPDFAKVKSTAERTATAEGIKYGSVMFGDVDEFSTFASTNKSVPKFELDGMRRAAEANERERLKQIEAAATAIGSTGPITPQAAEVELYAKIRNIAPKVSAEKLDKLVADGMKVVLAASDRKQISDKQADRSVALRALDSAYPQNQQRVYDLETQEEDRKTKAANAKAQEGYLRLKGQVDSVEAVSKDKKTTPAVKAELEAAMAGYAFMGGDASLFTQAVMSGDKALAAKIKARAIPADQYLENVNTISRVITGAHRFSDLSQATDLLSRLGTSTSAITRIGQEIAANDSTYLKSVTTGKSQSSSTSSSSERPGYTFVPKRGGGEWVKDHTARGGASYGVNRPITSTPSSNEMTETARMTSESLLKGFKQNVSSFIADMTGAIGENGSVAATNAELKAMAYKVALERSKALVSGMGLDKDEAKEMAEKVAQDIVAMTPEPMPIVKKVSRAELFKNDLQRQRELIGSPYGVETNVTQPYPVSGAASRRF